MNELVTGFKIPCKDHRSVIILHEAVYIVLWK